MVRSRGASHKSRWSVSIRRDKTFRRNIAETANQNNPGRESDQR
jgi:hypothetical protein